MSDWTLPENGIYEPLNAPNLSTSRPTLGATAQSSIPSMVWNELVASTARDYHGLWIQCPIAKSAGAAASLFGNYMSHYAIGAAGSEVPFYGGHVHHANASKHSDAGLYIPMYIPKGTRLSWLPWSYSGTATGLYHQIFGVTKGWHGEKGFTRYFRIGTDGQSEHFGNGDPAAANGLLGTRVTLPAAAGQDLSVAVWHELQSFCPFDTKYIIPHFQMCKNAVNDFEFKEGPANTGRAYVVQLGIGDKGDEAPISPLLYHMISLASSWSIESPGMQPGFSCYIPRGARVVARGLTSNADAGDNYVSVLVHAFG